MALSKKNLQLSLYLSGIVDKGSTNFGPGTPCFAVVFRHDASGLAQLALLQVPENAT